MMLWKIYSISVVIVVVIITLLFAGMIKSFGLAMAIKQITWVDAGLTLLLYLSFLGVIGYAFKFQFLNHLYWRAVMWLCIFAYLIWPLYPLSGLLYEVYTSGTDNGLYSITILVAVIYIYSLIYCLGIHKYNRYMFTLRGSGNHT